MSTTKKKATKKVTKTTTAKKATKKVAKKTAKKASKKTADVAAKNVAPQSPVKAAAEPAPQRSAARHSTRAMVERYERVAKAAYYIAERRGFKGGHEIEDWLEAERQIARAERS